jgi:hypothetical protein
LRSQSAESLPQLAVNCTHGGRRVGGVESYEAILERATDAAIRAYEGVHLPSKSVEATP